MRPEPGAAPRLTAGVDEAGRGPLAGPVVAAAVILDPDKPIQGLADSKTLSESKRDQLSTIIHDQALCCSLGVASVEEIDSLNILQATLLAMKRAVTGLPVAPALVLIDGNRAPMLNCPFRTEVKGDARFQEISAASIIAKVARDAMMKELDGQYPQYGFSVHKGYPTSVHLKALTIYGVSPVHRRSFAPVRKIILNN